jgi:hypothetical protein
MANTREEEIQNAETSKIDKIEVALNKLKNKESRVLIFVARGTNPAASIYEIYFHGKTLKNMGYNVTMLTDVADYEIPNWIEPELTDLPHEPMEKAKLTVGSQDMVIIPEIFSNVMEQTKNLPCIRIGLLQSVDYMLNALLPATDWRTFGIHEVITTSKEVVKIMEEYYGKDTFNINVSPPAIPEYFKNENTMKRPVISIVGRNPNEISKIVKLFYTKNPQYGWVTFDSMITDSKPPSPLRRVDYAERLKKNFATVWVDRISTFGTVPLEAMKAGSIPIGLMPDITPEYLLDEDGEFIENSGVWTRDIYTIAILIGDLVTKFLDDTIDDKVFEAMSAIADKYSVEKATERLEKIYGGIFQTRIDIFQKVVDDYKNKTEEVPSSIDEEAIKNEEITK